MPTTDDQRAGTITAAPAHRDGHDTEHGADDTSNAALRLKVWKIMHDHPGGLTDDEGADLLRAALPARHRIDRLTFGRRRYDLVQLGLVKKSTTRRIGPSGRPAIVWLARPSTKWADAPELNTTPTEGVS